MNSEKKLKPCLISSEKIRYFAKIKKLKSKHISEKLCICSRAYSNKLSYKVEFSDSEVEALTIILGCSRDDLKKDEWELSDIDKEFYKKLHK